jgi:hypothetical protein
MQSGLDTGHTQKVVVHYTRREDFTKLKKIEVKHADKKQEGSYMERNVFFFNEVSLFFVCYD